VSALRVRAEQYLAMRRALGFKLETQGPRLMSFVRFCEQRGAEHVTVDLAIAWATQTSRGSSDEVYQARRLDTVRIFARHLQTLDPATEVPPEDVLSRRYRRIPPYLYSPDEVAALMSAANGLSPAIRAATWRTLIGLLAVTGMRPGEACHLSRDDVDLQAGTAVIADSKFGKSRLVFLHPSAVTELRAYARSRDEVFPHPRADTFLVNSRGGPLDKHNIPHSFSTPRCCACTASKESSARCRCTTARSRRWPDTPGCVTAAGRSRTRPRSSCPGSACDSPWRRSTTRSPS
jgi:integrase/recombinase XerD